MNLDHDVEAAPEGVGAVEVQLEGEEGEGEAEMTHLQTKIDLVHLLRVTHLLGLAVLFLNLSLVQEVYRTISQESIYPFYPPDRIYLLR